MNKEELFYEAESKTARPHNYSIRYKHKEDIIYPSMVIRSQAETIELQNKKIQELTNNWNELEEWIKEYIKKNDNWYSNRLSSHDKQYYGDTYYNTNYMLEKFLNKMKEIKENNK